MWRPPVQIFAVILLTCGDYAVGDSATDLPQPPKPYQFGYTVRDDQSGDYKTHEEVSDGDGVRGEYTVAEPNGDLRVVTYTADRAHGFKALVKVHPRGSPVYHPTHSYDQVQQRSPHYPIIPKSNSESHNSNHNLYTKQSTPQPLAKDNQLNNEAELRVNVLNNTFSDKTKCNDTKTAQNITSTQNVLVKNINCSTESKDQDASKKISDDNNAEETIRGAPVMIQNDPTNGEPEMVQLQSDTTIKIEQKVQAPNDGNTFKYMKDHHDIKELTYDPSFPNVEIADSVRSDIKPLHHETVTKDLKSEASSTQKNTVNTKIDMHTPQYNDTRKEIINVRTIPQPNLNQKVGPSSRKIMRNGLVSDSLIFRVTPDAPPKIEKQMFQSQLKKLDGEDIIHIKSDNPEMLVNSDGNKAPGSSALTSNSTGEVIKGESNMKTKANSSIMLAALLLPTTPLMKLLCSTDTPGNLGPTVSPTASSNMAGTRTPTVITQEPLRLFFTTHNPFYPYQIVNLDTFAQTNEDKHTYTPTAKGTSDETSFNTGFDMSPTLVPQLISHAPHTTQPRPPNGYTSLRNKDIYNYKNRKTIQNVHYPMFLPPPWSPHPLRPVPPSHYRHMPIFVLPMSHNFNFAPTFDPKQN